MQKCSTWYNGIADAEGRMDYESLSHQVFVIFIQPSPDNLYYISYQAKAE